MTKEELTAFKKAYRNFENDCRRVCNILKRNDRSYEYIDEFAMDGDTVDCEGQENCGYGERVTHYRAFKAEYLTMSNEELNKMVDGWIEQSERDERTRLERLAKVQEEQEREMLKKLKEKYE